MPDSQDNSFAWLRNTGQLWKVRFEVGVGIFGYCAILLSVVLLVGTVLWRPFLFAAIALWTAYGVLRAVEIYVVYSLIKCPHCGHNPTRRKSDGRRMSPRTMYPRLAKMAACPHCRHGR